jgi:hypothetical protein
VFSVQIFQENTLLETKLNFSLTGKCFSLTNFSNGKQTQEILESGFPETTFQKINTAKVGRERKLSVSIAGEQRKSL